MFVYDDNHSLSSSPAEIDNIINTAIWLLEHTAEKDEMNSIQKESTPSKD